MKAERVITTPLREWRWTFAIRIAGLEGRLNRQKCCANSSGRFVVLVARVRLKLELMESILPRLKIGPCESHQLPHKVRGLSPPRFPGPSKSSGRQPATIAALSDPPRLPPYPSTGRSLRLDGTSLLL
jgi:hypothetical protein